MKSSYRQRFGFGWGIFALGLLACGSDGPADNDLGSSPAPALDGGNANGGEPDAGETDGGDAGPMVDYVVPVEMCGLVRDDATGAYEYFDTSAMGGCYADYCYLNEAGLVTLAAVGTGACTSATDAAIQCSGDPVTIGSDCARQNSALVGDLDMFAAAVRACGKEDPRLDNFSDECGDCNVEAARCAAEKCIAECLTGDSPGCDECRRDKGCTPAFYDCAGLPDPDDA